jgi:hypothetical protein
MTVVHVPFYPMAVYVSISMPNVYFLVHVGADYYAWY